jgi:hypothetical protein
MAAPRVSPFHRSPGIGWTQEEALEYLEYPYGIEDL